VIIVKSLFLAFPGVVVVETITAAVIGTSMIVVVVGKKKL
jgi:hypothetical protein